MDGNPPEKSATERNEEDVEQGNGLVDKRRTCCGSVNRKLLLPKAFYFLYFSSLGCIWPYLALYFKQLFLSPRQLGIIVAVRSFLQFVFTPVWGAFADKFDKGKCVLIMAVSAWLISLFSLAIVPLVEKPKACFEVNEIQFYANSTGNLSSLQHNLNEPDSSWFRADFYKYLPWSYFITDHSERKVYTELDTNSSSMTVADLDDTGHVSDSSSMFLLILGITVVGVIFGAPAQCLGDTATLQLLDGEEHRYGRQILWGSIGYGTFAFIMGASVSQNTYKNPCSGDMDTNYIPCFYAFGVLMFLCLMIAQRFHIQPAENDSKCKESVSEGIKVVLNIRYSIFIVVVFFCGTSVGFIQTFLVWHLHEIGGDQLLFSLIPVFNSTAEVTFYFLSEKLICRIGQTKVIYIGLLCYTVRFLYYAFCTVPWLVLPIELIQGITTAAVWSAIVSFVGVQPGVAVTLQGLVNGSYLGLGYATGGLVGGIMVHELGTNTTFLCFGEMSLFVMFVFMLVNNIRNSDQFKGECGDFNRHTADP